MSAPDVALADLAHDTASRPTSAFGPDGKTVIVAMDHALTSGQVSGLARPVSVAQTILQARPDATIASSGTGAAMTRMPTDVPWFLTADFYATSQWPGVAGDEERHAVLFGARHAASLGAAGLKCLWVHGRRDGAAQLEGLRAIAGLIEDARVHDVPVMVESVLWGRTLAPEREHDGVLVANAARMAFELGADVIKVALPDDVRPLAQVASALPVPIVVMGGPAHDPKTLFRSVRDALDGGVRGVALGRNVWQHRDPAAMVRALRALVHDDASVGAALDVLSDTASS